MRYWLAAAVMFCVALAALYLPPREPHRRESAAHRPPEIRARQQVEEKLAAAVWVTRVLEQRDSLLRTAAQTGLLEGDTIALMLDPGLPPLFQTLFSRFLEEPRRLMQDYPRLGPLIIATVVDTLPDPRGLPSRNPWGMRVVHVLPEATDGRTCLAIVDVGVWAGRMITLGRASPLEIRRLVPVSHLLGVSAYYLRFGPPGEAVGAWLAEGNYILGQEPTWAVRQEHQPLESGLRRPSRTVGWWDPYSRSTTFELDACAGGDHAACALAALGKEAYQPDPRLASRLIYNRRIMPPGVAPVVRYWSVRHPLGWTSQVYLADMVNDLGADRFQRFWSSDLPVDGAFAAAMEVPLDQWTMRWARAQVGAAERGPGVLLSSAAVGLLLAGAMVGGAMALVTRRQVY
jgi:hypothetical protein